MGIMETKMVTVKCEKCGIEEVNTATERGCSFNSKWGPLGGFKSFDIKIKQQGYDEPEIEIATCKKCRNIAIISEKYKQ